MLISSGLSLKNSSVKNVSQRKRSFSEQFFSSGAGIAANYDLVIQEFNGCVTLVLKGHPVVGKTTDLRAVMSVLGKTNFTSGMFLVVCCYHSKSSNNLL